MKKMLRAVQVYVIKSTSSGATGVGSDYQIVSLRNDPIVTLDQYDDIGIRGYNDDSPADAVPIAAGAVRQLHNFHDASDQDWAIFAMGSGSGVDISTVQLGVASARLSAYRIDGQFMEISPGGYSGLCD